MDIGDNDDDDDDTDIADHTTTLFTPTQGGRTTGFTQEVATPVKTKAEASEQAPPDKLTQTQLMVRRTRSTPLTALIGRP